jgi:hypothetical protein
MTAATTRLVLAALAASIAFAGVHGFAASFGAASDGLGATSRMVASCGTGLTLAYTTAFDPGISGDIVNGIDLSNIPAGCLGKTVSVEFTKGDEAVGSAVRATLPASGTTQTVSVATSSNVIDASQIHAISVVVS